MQKEPLKDGTIEAYRAGYKDLDRIWSVLSKTCGLSDAEYWSLLMIREGALTQHEISERLFMSKQTVNSAFRQLVKKGLVRLKAQEDNLRVKQIVLTEEGERFRGSISTICSGLRNGSGWSSRRRSACS